jgi:hypothetical protein
VPLPKTAAGDLAVEVKLVCAGRFGRPLPRGVQVLRSELDLPAPQVVAQGDFGMPVAATEWTVVVPPDIDARPIDDSARTNVAESGAGGEDLIAWYNEMQSLYAILLDDSQSMRAQSRARNNLKQIGLAVQNYNAVESRLVADDQNLRQQGQLLDLKSKLQQAEKQWQAQQAAQAGKRSGQIVITDGVSQTAVVGGALSNRDVQRELVAGNTADFQADRSADESELLPQIKLDPALPNQENVRRRPKMPMPTTFSSDRMPRRLKASVGRKDRYPSHRTAARWPPAECREPDRAVRWSQGRGWEAWEAVSLPRR